MGENVAVPETFVGYVGPPEVHDASVVTVSPSIDGLRVVLEMPDQGTIVVDFGGVWAYPAHEPEGMRLYSLTETAVDPPQEFLSPLRRFVFVNWDETDARSLVVLASTVSFSSGP
jgi:hypothetical protein